MSGEISKFQGWSIVEAARRVPHLREHLSDGQLLAWGRLGSAGAAFVPIPISKWAGKVTFAKTTASKRPHAICNEESIFNLSVFPVLLAPNLVEHLGYVSLKAIFSRFVVGDPEVQYLGGVASAKVPAFLSLYREGHIKNSHYWPVRFEELCWLGEPDEIAQKYMGYRSTPETDLAQRALRNRYEAMLNLLRSRHLVAEGDPVRPNDPQQIRSTIWESPTYYFDGRTGDLLEERDWGDEEAEIFRFDDGRENYVVRWRAVLLRPAVSDVPGMQHAEARIGRQKNKLQERFERCSDYLCKLMKASPNHKPKSKRMIFHDAKRVCGNNLGWPIFCEAWGTAKVSVPEAAVVWGGAGAPKKSYQK